MRNRSAVADRGGEGEVCLENDMWEEGMCAKACFGERRKKRGGEGW